MNGNKDVLAMECANVCLNLCYEIDNVELLVDSGGIVPLTYFLMHVMMSSYKLVQQVLYKVFVFKVMDVVQLGILIIASIV